MQPCSDIVLHAWHNYFVSLRKFQTIWHAQTNHRFGTDHLNPRRPSQYLHAQSAGSRSWSMERKWTLHSSLTAPHFIPAHKYTETETMQHWRECATGLDNCRILAAFCSCYLPVIQTVCHDHTHALSRSSLPDLLSNTLSSYRMTSKSHCPSCLWKKRWNDSRTAYKWGSGYELEDSTCSQHGTSTGEIELLPPSVEQY